MKFSDINFHEKEEIIFEERIKLLGQFKKTLFLIQSKLDSAEKEVTRRNKSEAHDAEGYYSRTADRDFSSKEYTIKQYGIEEIDPLVFKAKIEDKKLQIMFGIEEPSGNFFLGKIDKLKCKKAMNGLQTLRHPIYHQNKIQNYSDPLNPAGRKLIMDNLQKNNLSPTKEELQYMDILSLTLAGNNTKAIKKCEKLVEESPHYLKAIFLNGRIY